MYTEGNVKTFTAGEDLEASRRVKFSAGTVVYADAGEVSIGTTEYAKDNGELIAVRLNTASGTRQVTAAGTFSLGAELYGAADGKVDDTPIGQIYGTALEAATTGDGDIIEVLPHIGVQHISYDRIFGELLSGGTEQDLYEVSETQNYAYGTRRETPDGRFFKYAKSSGACYTGRGAGFCRDKAISDDCAAAVLKGASEITFANQTFDADELKGGFIIVFGNPDGAPNDANCPFRRITGNTACTDTTVTITVDQPFDRAIDNAQFCEVFYNPYAALKTLCDTTGTGIVSFAGVANVYIAEANLNFWVQYEGECWIAPQTASFGAGIARDGYFREDGTICALDDSVAKSTAKQRAGFIIPPGLTAGPLFMLQVR